MSSGEDLKGDTSDLQTVNQLQLHLVQLLYPEILRQHHYHMPCLDQTQIINHLRTSPGLNRMDPEQRNEVISEISNLVDRRLVTTALSGEL